MQRFRNFLCTVAAFLAIAASAQEIPMDNPITKAVMESYASMLKENPKDFLVLFRRANEYYNHNMYAKALADVNQAIEYAPTKEKDLRFQCYSLRASIFERMKKYPEAINDFNSALALDPKSYTILYQRANAEFSIGNYDAARASYKKLQSLNPRSQEAIFGLARVAARSGNTAEANKLADEGVNIAPQSSESYMQRAAVQHLLGSDQNAVADYIQALTLADGSNIGRPLNALVDLSGTDYNAVVNGLSSAISRSPRSGILYYLRGVVAQSHFHYPSAISDYSYILSNYLLDLPAVYRQLGECQYALMDYDNALGNLDSAIGSSADNIEAYVVKSDVKRAMGSYSQAVSAADRALAKSKEFAPALLAKGLAQIDGNFLTEGSISLGNAVVAEPSEPYYMLVRAWALADRLGQKEAADRYYEEVLTLKTYPETDVRSFRGFALVALGRISEATAWMTSVLDANSTQTDGEIEYYAACLYSAAGDPVRAIDMMEQSLKKGYANLYDWKARANGGINVAAIRTDPRFDQLLSTYAHIFK